MSHDDEPRDLLLPGLAGPPPVPSLVELVEPTPPELEHEPAGLVLPVDSASTAGAGGRILRLRSKRVLPPLTAKEVRFSSLKHMAKSPAHYFAALRRNANVQSDVMRFGVLVHTLVLGGQGYAAYDGHRRGKEWDAFRKARANRGKMLVSRAELLRARKVARAVKNDPIAGPLLKGKREQEIFWDHAGRRCGGRIDVIGTGGQWIADLKTAATADPAFFPRAALRMHYAAQLSWYREGAHLNGLMAPDVPAYVIAVEPVEPFAVVVYRIGDAALELGERSWRAWIERVRVCEDSNFWPGYTQTIAALDVPEEDSFALTIDGEEIAV